MANNNTLTFIIYSQKFACGTYIDMLFIDFTNANTYHPCMHTQTPSLQEDWTMGL